MSGLIIESVPFHDLADVDLAARAQKVLAYHYPGYTWVVGLDDEELGGVMTIMNVEVNEKLLGFSNWGYVLKLSRVYQDPNLKCVMMAGGEILESAGLCRSKNKNKPIKKIDGIDHNKFPLIKGK